MKIFLALALLPLSAQAVDFKVNGFVKAGVIGANRATATFGNENLGAPTSSRPKGNNFNIDDRSVTSFQVAQTRIGVDAIVSEDTGARVEFDFFDATKSTPFTQMNPRVRVAKVEHKFAEHWRLAVGQDWDIFAPLNGFTYNYVGNNFQAGNNGFLRQQIVFSRALERGEIKAALGMVAANATSTTTDTEKSKTPTVALSYSCGAGGNRFGASAIAGELTFFDVATGQDNRRGIYGFNLFGEKSWHFLQARLEAYTGQNLENSGTLALSRGRMAASLRDLGGFVSLKAPLTQNWSVFGTFGLAHVRNDAQLSSASTLSGIRRGFNADTLGIRQNRATKLGLDYKATDKLSYFAEASHFQTVFKDFGTARSYAMDVGLLLNL